MPRPSKYPELFRRDTANLARSSDRSLREVGRELGVNHETLWNWVNAAERAEQAAAGLRPAVEEISADEREELRRLRKKVAGLELEKEIPRKAAQYLRRRWVDNPPLPVHLRTRRVRRHAAVPCSGSPRRQGYYEWLTAQPARRARAAAEDDLADEIHAIHDEHNGAHGAPRIVVELRRRGRRANRKRVERIMRERHIIGITRRQRRSLTKPDAMAAPAPDLIGRDFTPPAPGQRLAGDITYLPTAEGWLYLATVIDLFNREVVGHAMAGHMRADLVCDAVELAPGRSLAEPDATFHSDSESQYTSAEFRATLTTLHMRASVDRVGSCYDNAVAPSFFATLKSEIGTKVWTTRAETRRAVFAYLAHYNRHRLHSTVKPRTPIRSPRPLPSAHRPRGMKPRCPILGWNLTTQRHRTRHTLTAGHRRVMPPTPTRSACSRAAASGVPWVSAKLAANTTRGGMGALQQRELESRVPGWQGLG